MDIIELHRNLHKKNILEKYSLPYDFFTTPCKLYDKETCLHEILYLLIHNKIIFETDSSYLQYFIPKSKGTPWPGGGGGPCAKRSIPINNKDIIRDIIFL